MIGRVRPQESNLPSLGLPGLAGFEEPVEPVREVACVDGLR